MENIALNKPTVSSSYVKPYTAANAVSGTITPFSRWLCNTTPGWMYVDLGIPTWVNRWVVRHMPVAGWRTPDFVNCDFKLQGSNNATSWIDLDAVAGNTSAITDRTTSAQNFRYFRVYVTKGLKINTQMASIMEFELYPAPPTSPNLTNLTPSAGTLNPVFNKTTAAYTATVDNSVSAITLTPIAEDANATIKVNGVVVKSGVASQPVNLNVGSNTITVNVTSQIGGLVQNYTVTVTRLANNYLSGLIAQAGTVNIPLAPDFNKDTLGYTASVGYDAASITVTPTAENSASTITVNGTAVASGSASAPINLNTGSNTVTIMVTNAGNTRTYTITVTRADSSYLSALTVQSGSTVVALSPTPFVKTTMGYSATVGFDVSGVTVTPTAEGASAAITVNGSPVVSGQPSAAISLAIGTTSIPVVVTAGGVTQTYTITITRVDTSLSNLVLKAPPSSTPLILAPPFQSATFQYAVTATGKTNISFTPTAPAAGAIITVGGTQVNSGASTTKTMVTGPNLILVVVTIGNVSTTYKVTVTK